MKLRLSINFVVSILFATMLAVSNTAAQEASSAESTSTHSNDDFSLPSANALLKPPNTVSPRETLRSFIENMNLAYGLLMKAHRENLNTPGYFPSESVRQMEKQAHEHFDSGVECLNLSQIPKNLKENTGYESAIMLKEVFDRIDLPPFKEIPNAEAIEAEEEKEKIYKPFFSTKIKGMGLGLHITLKLLRSLNGELDLLVSKPGKTVFTITIPEGAKDEK